MKRLILLVPLVSAVLSACGDPVAVVDPTTLTFTATGKVTNFTPDRDYTLSLVSDFAIIPDIGILGINGVKISISPENARKLQQLTFSDLHKDFSLRCDTSKLSYAGGEYRAFDKIEFIDASGVKSNVFAQKITNNPDGTVTRDSIKINYATQAGSLKGEVDCPTTSYNSQFDIDLSVGWNVVHELRTYDPKTFVSTALRYTGSQYTTTYSGEWMAFTAN